MNTYYFAHDCDTQRDAKIKLLLKQHGYLGYGIFWALVEDLYINNNTMDADYETLAFSYRAEVTLITSIVNDFKLFIVKGGKISSKSVGKRLKERSKKSKIGRDAALTRWTADANVLPTHCEPNAIKEKKIKENKEKQKRGEEEQIKAGQDILEDTANTLQAKYEGTPPSSSFFNDRVMLFRTEVNGYSTTYKQETLNDFCRYWSEPNATKTKMKWELEPTWSTTNRLEAWMQRELRFEKTTTPKEPEKPVRDYAAERRALEERSRQFGKDLFL